MKLIYLASGLIVAVMMFMGCSASGRQPQKLSGCDCAEHVWGMVDPEVDELALCKSARAYLTQCLDRPMTVSEAMTTHDLDVLIGLGTVYVETYSAWSGPIHLGNSFLKCKEMAEDNGEFSWYQDQLFRVMTIWLRPRNDIDLYSVSFQLFLDRPLPRLLAGDSLKPALLAGALSDYRIVGWAINITIQEDDPVVLYEGRAYTHMQVYLLDPSNSADDSIFGGATTQPEASPAPTTAPAK